MSPTERREATNALRAVLAALLASGGNGAGQDGADLRRRVGALSANASDRVELGDFGPDLRACFEAATAAGSTFDGMDRVRLAATGFPSTKGAVQRVVQTSLRHALVQMSLILTNLTFQSRPDVEAALARIVTAFEPAEEFAADQRDNEVFRALIGLRAAVVRDLTTRARPLPSIVPFDLGPRRPALLLAQQIYGDAGRTDDLIAENKPVHPLFMRGSGRALAT